MKAKRDAAERARHPLRTTHLAPALCAHCRPLLDTERRMHAEAFETVSQALGQAQDRIRELEAQIAHYRQTAP